MTTAVIGTGGIGSVIARELASGGESLRLSSANQESARKLAARIGRTAVVAADNRDALRGADAVVLALRFTVLKGVIGEIAGPLTGKVVVVPSNPFGIDAQGNVSRLLPEGQSSGEVVAGRLPAGARLAMALEACRPISSSPRATAHRAGGPVLRDRRRPCWPGNRAVDPNGRLRAGEGRRDRAVEPARGGRRPSRSRSRPRGGAVIDRCGLTIATGVVTLASLSDLDRPSAAFSASPSGPVSLRRCSRCSRPMPRTWATNCCRWARKSRQWARSPSEAGFPWSSGQNVPSARTSPNSSPRARSTR